MKIGLISDTHGFLDGRVFELFKGVDHILHAGDVEDDSILDELALIASVNAVSGNVDVPPNARRPLRYCGDFDGVRVCMTHGHLLDSRDYNQSALDFFADDNPRVIIHGHSHLAKEEAMGGVLFVNPGPAGRQRFRQQRSVAILEIDSAGDISVELLPL